MSYKTQFYPEAKFGGFTDCDGTITFYNRVNALIQPSFIVLDVGCGRGGYSEDEVLFRKRLRILKGKVAKVIGIDTDQGARENPFLDDFFLMQGESWPIESDSIDLIVCDNVLEHVLNPRKFFSESSRVLKNGGYLCIRTPNRWSYVAMAVMFVPNKYHPRLASLVQERRKEEDVFPVFYKCNSIRKLRNILKDNAFEAVIYGYEAEPSYLSFSKFAYWLGVLHQRLSPRFLKPAIFAFGKIKKEAENE